MTEHNPQDGAERGGAARGPSPAADPRAGDGDLLHGGGRRHPPRQLPPDIARLAGRAGELARLHAELGQGSERVTVLTGMPGVGKTALAVRLAREVSDRYPDGQLFLDLQPAGRAMRPETALRILLGALGLADSQIPKDLEARAQLYRSVLAGRRVLLVLDNAASAGQISPLLPAGPGPLVLVTSRARLANLDAPGSAVVRLGLGPLEKDSALELIAAITAGQRPADEPEELVELARVCRGVPLALRIAAENAAARPHMPLGEVLDLLLGAGSPWLEPSAYGLEAAAVLGASLAFSRYHALPQDAAGALRRLSAIPGTDFSLHCAAAAVGEGSERVRMLLDVLAGADLIEKAGAGRWRMHELQRAFAAAQALAEDDEQGVDNALARIVHWHLAAAAAAGRASESLRTGPELPQAPAGLELEAIRDVPGAIAWYRAEQPQLLALMLAAAEAGLDGQTWRLAVALGPLYAAAGDLAVWREIAETGLDAARRCGDALAVAWVQLSLATVLGLTGHTRSAEAALAEAEDAFAAGGDASDRIDAANRAALLYLWRRDLEGAAARFGQVLESGKAAGLEVWSALAHENLADVAFQAGHLADSEQHARAAIALYEEAGADVHLYVGAFLAIARSRRASGDLEASADYRGRAALIVADLANNRWLEYALLYESGCWHTAAGEPERALTDFWRCVGLARDLGEHTREAPALTGIADGALMAGRSQEAAQAARGATVIAQRERAGFAAADALRVLSQALDLQGEAEGATRARQEAAALLKPYTDPGAAALRAVIAHML